MGGEKEVNGDFFRHKVSEKIPKIQFLPLPASGRGHGGWVKRLILRIFGVVKLYVKAIP
jgi:hypothetical protein